MSSARGRHPQVGSTHKNGDRMFGIAGPYARDLAARGTPKLSSLYHSTVTELIRSVRVGDELRVEWDGMHWWASSARGSVGRLTWSKGLRAANAYSGEGRSPFDFDDGVLHVQTVTINAAGDVVDCGGYVVPDGYDASEWSRDKLAEPLREIHGTYNAPARTAPLAQTAPRRDERRSWLERLLRR